VHGQSDGLGLVGQGSLDGLFDPPGAVGGQLATLGGIEALHAFHKADIPFVDQVQKGQA